MRSVSILKFLIFIPLFIVSCSSSDKADTSSNTPFENHKWILKTLNNKKVVIPESGKDIYVIFKSDGNRAEGYGGCNNFFGSYKLNKNKIELSKLASTEMFCESMMETESDFLKTLGITKKFKIKGNKLQLYDSSKIIATLEYTGVSDN